MSDLVGWLETHKRFPGNVRLQRAIELAEPATESPMETRLRLLLVLAGLPRPQGQRDQAQRDQSQRDQRGARPQQQQGFDGTDPGNRRSRRRRGRDRSDRDIQQDRGQDPQQYSGELVPAEGLLDLRDEGYGFLRTGGYLAGSRDAYVSLSQVRRFE